MTRLARLALMALALAAAPAAGALAQSLQLSGSQYWVAVASSRDLDTAIGIAQLYREEHPRVVRSANGWYGAVFGPVTATTIESFRASRQGWPDLPSDALLSRGSRYVETVWQPNPDPVMAEAEIDAATGATISAGGITVRAQPEGTNANGEAGVHLFAYAGSTPLFDMRSPEDFYIGIYSRLRIVRLDPATRYPQIVLTRYSGGAHCCTGTWIYSESPQGGWGVTQGQELDSDGYAYEDVDGDGGADLLSVDNTFHYLFDSYAGSFAPLKIAKFAGGTITDVSAQPAYRFLYRRQLAGMDFEDKLDPGPMQGNGFIAGWVALKARVGEFEDAWAKILPLYDRNSEFGYMVCPDGTTDCDWEQQMQLPFPQGLARHLLEQGYITAAQSPMGGGQPPPLPPLPQVPGQIPGQQQGNATQTPAGVGTATAAIVAPSCFEPINCAAGACDVSVRIEGPPAQTLLLALKSRVAVDPQLQDIDIPLYASRDGGLSCLDQPQPYCELRLDTGEATLTPVPICD